MLGVLFMRDETPIGVMTLLRNIVQPFANAEADLATTFADKAIIASENVRAMRICETNLEAEADMNLMTQCRPLW